jgi:hypothetical protein
MADTMQEVAVQWMRARNIIANFLRELRPNDPQSTLDHNAAAIISRLGAADPPLLICEPDELKD